MSDWTAGYVADIGYTYGYYSELNPQRIKMAFLNAGLAFPDVGHACELGFGQGISVSLHAAATITEWHGTDFNPSQTSFAQDLASASGAKAKLLDESFAEFCGRTDLPDFDSIGLHGIWSWISDENRSIVVDFIRRKLKVGGVLYISYNTQPGWAAMVPMRDLLADHAEVMSSAGNGIIPRIDSALEFAESLMAANPLYARANPHVAERLEKMKGQNRSYLAHEYFNRDWLPMSFANMWDWLAPAKLSYACSASYLEHIDAVNLTTEQQEVLKKIPDAMFRETVRDFMVNQSFRRDYWVRGPRSLSNLERNEELRALRVVLGRARKDVALKVLGALGEATLHEPVYKPVLDALADYKPYTLAELESRLAEHGISFAQLVQAVMVLVGAGALHMAQDGAHIEQVRKQCDRINLRICKLARASGDILALASPVTGGGIPVGRFQQLFLLARATGLRQPGDWANYVGQLLEQQGQRLLKDGVSATTSEEQLEGLAQMAEEFAEHQLPMLKALGMVS